MPCAPNPWDLRSATGITAALVLPGLLIGRAVAEGFLVLTCLLFLAQILFGASEIDDTPIPRPLMFLFLTWANLSLVTLFLTGISSDFLSILAWGRFPIFLWAWIQWIDHNDQNRSLLGFGCATVFAALIFDGYFQYFSGFSIAGYAKFDSRLTSFLNKPCVGLFLSWLFLPLLIFAHKVFPQTNYKKPILLGIFSVAFTLIFLTGDRTAFLLLTFGLLAMAAFMCLQSPSLLKSVLPILGTALLLITSLVIFEQHMQKRALLLIEQILNFKKSSYANLFQTAFQMAEQSPWWGFGFNGFRDFMSITSLNDPTAYKGLHPHNFYLEVLSEGGIFSLIPFIGSVLTLFWWARKHPDTSLRPVYMAYILVLFWPLAANVSFFSNLTSLMLFPPLSLLFSLKKPFNFNKFLSFYSQKNIEL